MKALIIFAMKNTKGTWTMKAMTVEHIKDLLVDMLLEFAREHALKLSSKNHRTGVEAHAAEQPKTLAQQISESMSTEMTKFKQTFEQEKAGKARGASGGKKVPPWIKCHECGANH